MTPDSGFRWWTFAAGLAPVYLLLLYRNPAGAAGVHPLLYLASWVVVLHLSRGIYVMMRHLPQPRGPASRLLDAALLVLLCASPWTTGDVTLWAGHFTVFFSLAVLKYFILKRDARARAEREYIDLKIRNEWPVIPLLVLLGGCGLFAPHHPCFTYALETIALTGAIAFWVWIARVKKAYRRVTERHAVDANTRCSRDRSSAWPG